MPSGWEVLLSVATVATQIISTLSLVPDLYQVYKYKSTGDMIVFPLVAMIVNYNVWTMYGYMTNNILPLFASSLFGEIVATGCTLVYLKYSLNRAYVLRTVAVGAIIFFITTLYVVLGTIGVMNQSLKQVCTIHGYISVVINVFMFISPLEKVRMVVQTQNSSSIPVNLSVMIFVNCCLWDIVAIVKSDTFLLVPNVIGVVLSAIQLSLYYIYRQPKDVEQVVSKIDAAEILIQDAEKISVEHYHRI